MKHAKAEEWSDRQRTIQKYGEAIEALTPRQKVANAANRRCQVPAPRGKSSRGEAAFATACLESRPDETGGLIQLLFDSFSQPPCPGTRSAATRIRQMLYRAEPYQVDLQIDLQQERNRLIVTGQLLDVNRPEIFARDVQVTLSNCGASIAATVTNQFGEFHGEIENSGDLDISFPGRRGKPIVILLRGVVDPSP